jgi:C-terminal processing protease CtpA/Prc
MTLPAQQNPPKYSIGVNLFGPNASCPAGPVFIGSVDTEAPAGIAGVHVGDQLLAVDGRAIRSFSDASTRMAATKPGRVVLTLRRDGADLVFSISRERSDEIWSQRSLRELDDGRLVPLDYTEAQLRDYSQMQSDLLHAMQTGDYLNVFSGHYPADLSLYYPGFELFSWNHGQEVIVGGIEDGPAKKSGIRWGDQIVSVNGIDPRGKSLTEIEHLFSSSQPVPMNLVINHFGIEKQITFLLARASDVMRANRWRMFEGAKVPLWVPDEYAHCFK